MQIGAATRALVTGASRGIGRALSVELAGRGARLGLLARGAEGLEALVAELPGDHVVLPADVGNRLEIEPAVERFVAEAGGIDLLIANAGIAHYGPFVDIDVELAEELVQVNVLGTIYTLKAGLAPMLDQRSGHVVVVSSAAGLRAFPSAATYGATKAAVRALAEALRHELSGTGIGLTTAFPGETKTDLHAHEPDRMPEWHRGANAVEPEQVAIELIAAIEADRRAVFTPAKIRALGLNGLAPRLADRILKVLRGDSIAPRRD